MLARLLTLRVLVCVALVVGQFSPAHALSRKKLVVLLGASCPSSLALPGLGCPPAVLSFTTNQGMNNGGVVLASSLITNTRASAATCQDTSGNLYQVGRGVTCITNYGAASFEARTNSLRNNTMQGAVVGSPGTAPTHWTISSGNGLTASVVNLGTESGMPFMDVQIAGTTTTTLNGTVYVLAEATTQIAATYGQTWSASMFAYVIGGSLSNVTIYFGSVENNSSGVNLAAHATVIPVGAFPLGANPLSVSASLSNSSTDYVGFQALQITASSGVAINFTLRIGLPQLENNSLISSTVASATVNASGTGGTNGTAVYSVGGGTLASGGSAATLNVTVSGGAITAINSVAAAGSYTVFPPSAAALTYVSGTGSGVTGATVNLTPTNLAADAFATPPILTSGSAVTRATDNVMLANSSTFGAAYSFYASGVPYAPATYTAHQQFVSLGTASNNYTSLFRINSPGAVRMYMTIAGSQQYAVNIGAGTLATGSLGKAAQALATGAQTGAFNGSTQAETNANIVAPTAVYIGSQTGAGQSFNGYIQKVAVWPTTALSAQQLQSITTINGLPYLLQRDIDPASNDNSPAFMKGKAA